MQDELDQWKASVYAMHERCEHPLSATKRGEKRFIVTTGIEGPDAVMLERALALNGLLEGAREQNLYKRSLEIGLDRLKLESVIVHVGAEKVAIDDYWTNGRWPERGDSIKVNVLWMRDGEQTREALSSDLALTGTATRDAWEDHPANAQVVVTKDTSLDAKALADLILAAYSGVGTSEIDQVMLDEHRAAADAIADIALNGKQGRLSAIERLVSERVLPCLPANTRNGGAVAITLWKKSQYPINAVECSGAGFLDSDTAEKDPRTAQERHNRLRYEATPFAGHRGMLLGRSVTRDTKLWNAVLNRADGEQLWEPESDIKGQLVELTTDERRLAVQNHGLYGVHAVAWATETTGSRIEAVHLLSTKDVEDVRRRMVGPLLDQAIGQLLRNNMGDLPPNHMGDLPPNHPLRLLAEEYKARGKRLP